MNTISTYAIEAGARAIADAQNVPFVGRKQLLLVRAALTAAAPILRDEAWDAVIVRIDLGTPYMVDEKYVAGAEWVKSQIIDVLRTRVNQLEGESE